MNNKVLDTIEEYNMLAAGDTIVAGVSGGADSMCLLHFLCSIREKLNLTVIAAHVNHNLRKDESKCDEDFVRLWCTLNGVKFKLLSVDINTLAKQKGKGTEELGREVRYDFFKGLAGEKGKIATAHTLSDSAETMLFNFARGTGARGMCGIPAVRGNIIRPLIGITRAEVEEYCEKNKIEFVTDSTNLQDNYNRNKIRHSVVPVFKDINSSFELSAQRAAKLIFQQNEYISRVAKDAFKKAICKGGYENKRLSELENPVLCAGIVAVLESNGLNCFEEKHIALISKIIKKGGGAVNLPGNFTVIVKQGIFRVSKVQKTKNAFEIPINNANNLIKYNKKLTFKVYSKVEFNKISEINNLSLKNFLDYDIINSDALLRSRKEGDVFTQYGRKITKTVKKLFNESRIPAEKRDEIFILSQNDEILWIERFGASQRAAANDKTERFLYINTEDLNI